MAFPNVHRVYLQHINDWMFYRRSYVGGPEYLRNYLGRHKKESPTDWKRRQQRAAHYNITRSIIDVYVSYLFESSVQRNSGGADILDEMWSSMDLIGTDADDTYQEALSLAMQTGHAWAVVDRNDGEGVEPALTRAQEEERGVRPIVKVYAAEDCIDWSMDRHGRFRFGVVREELPEERDWESSSPTKLYQYRVWTPTEWILYRPAEGDIEGKADRNTEYDPIVEGASSEGGLEYREVQRGSHPVGEVPIVPLIWGRRMGSNPVGESAITDIAPLNKRITNFGSLIDEQIYQHVFNILVLPKSAYDSIQSSDWGVAGSLAVPDDATFTPMYLGPSTEQLGSIRSEMETDIQTVRVLSGIGRQNETSKAAVSGVSMSLQTQDKRALMGKIAKRMTDFEKKVDELALRWMNRTIPEDLNRKYDSDWDEKALNASLEEAVMFAGIPSMPPAALTANISSVLRHRFKDEMETDELEKLVSTVEKELEENPPGATPIELEGEENSPPDLNQTL